MKYQFIQWLRFFGLSFFSDSVSGEAPRRGYRNMLLAIALAFLFFWAGFMCAGTVPFSHHYENAGAFKQFVASAFSEENENHRITLTVENGSLKASADKEAPSEKKIVNTYTDGTEYSVNGYNLIVDTRPAKTPVAFTQTGVSESGEKISYEQYLSLSGEEKQKYTLRTEYTDEEIILDGETCGKFEEFLKNDEQSAESYGALQEKKNGLTKEEYRMQLYSLYVSRYYQNAVSETTSSDVPVLRDYYYRNYILELKTDYLYVFGDIVYGSFTTDAGVRINFGGYVSAVPDGDVADIGELIKAVFYGSVNNTVTSYFLNTMMQLPFAVIIPLIIALIVWGAGKISKSGAKCSYGGCVKIIGSYIWFSAFITGLVTFALGFLLGGTKAYSLILPVYSGILAVRSAVYIILKTVREKKESKKTETPSGAETEPFGGLN